MKKKILFLFLIGLVLNISAQNINPNKNLKYTITFLEKNPIIDGNILGEKIWENVTQITDLKQIKPDYNSLVSEKTSIRVAHTNKVLYVAVICYDKILTKL